MLSHTPFPVPEKGGDERTIDAVSGLLWSERQKGRNMSQLFNAEHLTGDTNGICGDARNIWGDATGLRGNVTNLIGDVTHIHGNVSRLRGDVSGLRGDVSHLVGDATGVKGTAEEIFYHVLEVIQLLQEETLPAPQEVPGDVG